LIDTGRQQVRGPVANTGPPLRIEGKNVIPKRVLCMGLLLAALTACRGVRTERSFDAICAQISGKTAAEVEALLGRPNRKSRLPIGDWRYVWWDYAVLEGDNYPPELRGKTVHLEIVLSHPTQSSLPLSQWRVEGPLAVSYEISRTDAGGARPSS